MKINFYLSNSLMQGAGGEKWVLDIASKLNINHKIKIIGLSYLSEKRFEKSYIYKVMNNFTYYEFPYLKAIKGVALPHPLIINNFINELNSSDVSYIMAPAIPLDLLLYFLKKKITCSLIIGLHSFLRYDNLLEQLYSPIFRYTLNSFHNIHVLNQSTFNFVKNLGNKNIYNIPNGVDTNVFQLCNNPSHSKSFNIFFSGRLANVKGIEILIKILQYINDNLTMRDINFIIAGSGPLKDVVEKYAKRYDNLQYLGFVPHEIISRVYRRSHLLLIPSIIEGMPLSLLEAQSCGLPAIGSNIPGISDIIVNGKTGRLINFRNLDGFIEAIKEYYKLWLRSPDEYYQLNRAIREHIIKNYDYSIIIDRIEKMFTQAQTRGHVLQSGIKLT